MPSFASGKTSCTAWASTCAVEWRSTFSPSGLSSATGSTATSSAGRQSRSRSWPCGSRTTTIAFGPLIGRPAAATASAAVVPAATTTGSATTGVRGADTVTPSRRRYGSAGDRPLRCYRSPRGVPSPTPLPAGNEFGPR